MCDLRGTVLDPSAYADGTDSLAMTSCNRGMSRGSNDIRSLRDQLIGHLLDQLTNDKWPMTNDK